jgi:hypothetical protein
MAFLKSSGICYCIMKKGKNTHQTKKPALLSAGSNDKN